MKLYIDGVIDDNIDVTYFYNRLCMEITYHQIKPMRVILNTNSDIYHIVIHWATIHHIPIKTYNIDYDNNTLLSSKWLFDNGFEEPEYNRIIENADAAIIFTNGIDYMDSIIKKCHRKNIFTCIIKMY